MTDALFDSISLIDASGYAIIAAIIGFLVLSIALTFYVRARYARLARDLRLHAHGGSFQDTLLNSLVEDTRSARARRRGEVDVQALVEHRFHAQLGGLLIAERFIKAATGLMIILGLVGTFYGLTLSIGKLVALVSSDTAAAVDVTQSLTTGLTQALSGMSVAFSTSLVGILAAIITTTLGVFASVADRREAIMVEIEAYLENEVLAADVSQTATDTFSNSVIQLQGVVERFHASLELFASNTRDFGEFNAHLKDNIQRMSLAFADMSDTLKRQVEVLRPGRQA